MAATGQLYNCVWVELKVINYSNFTITFPTIWRYARDFFRMLLKFKMADTDQLNNFCVHNNLKTSSHFFKITFPTMRHASATFFSGHTN